MLNQNGDMRRLFLFALIVLVGWYLFARWWPRHNLRLLSAHLETVVNRRLTEFGVTDSQIISEIHREKSRWGLVWVESERNIQLTSGQAAAPLITVLRSAAGDQSTHITVAEDPNSTTVTMGLGPFVFQRIILLTKPAALPAQTAAPGPEVAFVIDDTAYDLGTMDRYTALGVPLTFAVLPRDRHSRAIADKAHDLKFAVILHLPMEPIDLAHNDPGGAGLYLRMTPGQLHEQFEKDVASVPHIVGINNHMGSAFTEDESKMELVMRWVKEKHLFFLDSRTSMHSIVPRAAKRIGVPCLINETFLDNSDDVAAIEHQLDQVLALAVKHGRTIAIGHYRRKHLAEALAQKIPEFRARGVNLVTLPTLYPR